MVAIGALLATLAPTAKAVGLQVALGVGTDIASNYISDALGNESGQLASQLINAVATGGDPTQAITELGTNFVTGQIDDRLGAGTGQTAVETVQALLNNDTDKLGQLGTDQVNQLLQLLAQQQAQQGTQQQQPGATIGNAHQMYANQTQPNRPGLMNALAMGVPRLAGQAMNTLQEATKPQAHLDPNNAPAERIWLPQHKESLLQNIFGRPAPAPTARVNMQDQPLTTPSTYREDNSPLINKGRYQV